MEIIIKNRDTFDGKPTLAVKGFTGFTHHLYLSFLGWKMRMKGPGAELWIKNQNLTSRERRLLRRQLRRLIEAQ